MEGIMKLMAKKHGKAVLAVMMLCGFAMPVMAETNTPVVVGTEGTTVSDDITVTGTTPPVEIPYTHFAFLIRPVAEP